MNPRQSGYALKRQQSHMPASATQERMLETRQAIVTAARDVLLEKGYHAARIEDIVAKAAISRPTFYRYFEDKFEVAKAYHTQSRGEFIQPWGALADLDFREIGAIMTWLEQLFSAYAARRDELVIWAEMSSVEPGYLMRMPRQMPDVIERLAETIPAFARAQGEAPDVLALDGEPGNAWVDAYLLLEHLSYTCTWLALGEHPITSRQSIRYFAERFCRFIERYDTADRNGSGQADHRS